MAPKVRGYIRDPITGAGENAVTVTLKKHVDNSTVTSDATDANGLYEMDNDTVGNPGPVYETVTVGATTKYRSGNVVGQIAGMLWVSDILDLFEAYGAGVLKNAGSELAVSASGADMQTSIAAGVAFLKDGVLYVQESSKSQTHTAADGSNPRIDRVILRMTREGQTEQGKIVRAILTGTPAGSPTAPALTQNSTTWEISLAQVLVGTGVAVIAANKVTDERTYAFFGTAAGTFAEGNHAHASTYQPLDAELTAIAGLTSAADRLPYFTGSGTAALATFTAAGRALVDDADAAAQRTTLGLGTLATQAAGSVSISGGTITGITDLAVADGGTGASDAAAARTNLGLVIGTNVQAFDAELSALAGLTSAADKVPYFTGSGTAALADLSATARTLLDDASTSAMRTTLGLAIGTDVQAADATLAALAGMATGSDKLPYFSGVDTITMATFTSAARSLLDDASTDAMKTTLGLTVGTDVAPVADPTFTGTLTAADLVVTGNTTLGNASSDTTSIQGRIITVGGDPGIVAGAAAGSGSIQNISGDNQSGQITFQAGSGQGAGVIATVTFGSGVNRGSTNYGVWLNPRDADALIDSANVRATPASGTTWELIARTALNTNQHNWDYVVIEH
jgi:hypothetical protein